MRELLTERRERFLGLAIAALGFVLRAHSIGDGWLNADEGIYYFVAHAPLEASRRIIELNAHPPLFYLLLKAIALCGDHHLWLRLPSLLFGTLAINAMYRLARPQVGVWGALLAALLLAISPGAITLSQVARPYALLLWLLIEALSRLFAHLEDRDRGRDLWCYVGWIFPALLLHYSTIPIVFSIGVLLLGVGLRRRWDRRAWQRLVTSHLPLLLILGLLFSTHIQAELMGSAMQRRAVTGWLSGYFVSDPFEVIRNVFGLADYFLGENLASLSLFAAVCGFGACLARKQHALAGLCGLILLIAVSLSAAELFPFGGTRHSIYLLPLFILIAVQGCTWLFAPHPRWRLGAAICVTALLVVSSAPQLGVGPFLPRAKPIVELPIPTSEAMQLIAHLEEIKATPGLLLTDQKTASLLAPLFLASRQAALRGDRKIGVDQFSWGERHVIISNEWRFPTDSRERRTSAHLDGMLLGLAATDSNRAALPTGDLRIVADSGSRIPVAIQAIAPDDGGLVTEVFLRSHFTCFRLALDRYRDHRARTLESASPTTLR